MAHRSVKLLTAILVMCWMSVHGYPTLHSSSVKTWSEARQQCESEGGNLVAGADDATLLGLLGENSDVTAWIGMAAVYRDFRWVDGTEVTDTSNLPSVTGNRECVRVRASVTLVYEDYDCDSAQMFVCDSAQPPSPGYVLHTTAANFDAALSNCESEGMRLVHDDSADKHRTITTFLVIDSSLSASSVWIGARTTASATRSEDLEWTNGTLVPEAMQYWGRLSPNNDSPPICVAAITIWSYEYAWADKTCTSDYAYLCEVLATPTTTGVITTTEKTTTAETTAPSVEDSTYIHEGITTTEELTTAQTTEPSLDNSIYMHTAHDHIVCVDRSTDVTTNALVEALSITLDNDNATCMNPFDDGRSYLQITYNITYYQTTLDLQIISRGLSCTEPYLLVYYDTQSLTPVKRQCWMVTASAGSSSDFSVCLFQCSNIAACETPLQATLLLYAPTWAPETHRNSELCEVYLL